jgi:small-conductance mechanosensitive channel
MGAGRALVGCGNVGRMGEKRWLSHILFLHSSKTADMFKYYLRIVFPLILTLLFAFSGHLVYAMAEKPGWFFQLMVEYSNIFVILFLSWTLYALVKLLKKIVLAKYDIDVEDNLVSRKVHTQINILERIILFFIALFAVGLILLSFDKIREIGLGLFASAGLAGIIIGLSAQRVVGALLAGLQIAFTQPFRIEDAVLVENEFGWIEEINLTYVVIRIWDKRRLVLPSTYFLDKPFQNWTRTTADLIGTVFIYTDYSISFSALRDELDRILEQTDLWDGKVKVLQVTNAKETSVELRLLVSAKNAPTAWDLRVHVREKMIEFIQANYPTAFSKTRVLLERGGG